MNKTVVALFMAPEQRSFYMRTYKLLTTLLIVFFIMAGFSSADNTQDTKTAQAISMKVEQEPLKYTLGPDDVIIIDVRRHSEFSGEYTLNSEGKIQYKFIGDIPLSGLNKTEAREKIKTILSKFVVDPDVDITISQYRSKVIYIVGEVGAPGKYYMRADLISLREAVMQAGLPTLSAAMRRTTLVHPDAKERPKTEIVDLYKLIYEGKLELDKNMLPGDVLYVPSTMFAKVMRVINPVAAPITPASTIERASTGNLSNVR